ncbi:hypothetical protein [Thermocrinis jamiesonii]|uniref:hypothetical protein n=1 Tax=Thermocrinis jamiesonii TaxID=1302351 RepID=UPI000497BDDB|nr:hypothetical protein [Thermocrinis jamiesonii]
MRYIVLSILLITLNFLYSAYSIRVAKEYASKLTELRKELEKNLSLRVSYSNAVNYLKAKEWTKERGFIPVSWDKVSLID